MTRIKNIAPEQAQGEIATTYDGIKKAMGGKVINLFQALGNSNAALNGYLQVGGLLKSGHLSAQELETIALVSAQSNGCEYCQSAHTVLGKMAGLSEDQMVAVRKGTSTDPKTQALVGFVKEVLAEKGKISDTTFKNLQIAGYTDAQVPEIFLAITQNIYTNYFNNFNKTEVDFPKAQAI